ncbi:MAG TPA: ribose 5-phosphate isomerase B [Thermoanaerobaculia bacterium]|nr:ribose 5-phosphate isomerase B [Thermoanaerobaculia bacterium]
MRIAFGADHAGYELKERLKAHASSKGHDVLDLGTRSADSVDYPDFGRAVGEAVAGGRADRGVAVCGTGIGIAIAANKVAGVRAGVPNDLFATRLMREHNDANVIAFGARLVAPPRAEAMLDLFLETPCAGGRHERRVKKLNGEAP